jgi:hypothetical protein
MRSVTPKRISELKWRLSLGAVLAVLIPAATAGAAPPDPATEVAPGVYIVSAADASDASEADLQAIAAARSRSTTEPVGGSNARARSRSAPEPTIAAGNTTTISEWPWQVAITADAEFFPANAFDRQICGGTLVAPNIVVSAAHCFFDSLDAGDDGFDDPDLFAAITGRTQLSSSEGQEVEVSDYAIFVDSASQPLYDPITFEWDVIFAQLASGSSQQTIKIAGPGEGAVWEPGRDAFATGWGYTSSGGPKSDVLREIGVKMVADRACGSHFGHFFFPNVMVCAGDIGGLGSPCPGDSGGPLVVPIAGGGFRLIGDISLASCPNPPGIYGRLADDPIRSALANGILSVAGVNVLGSGARLRPGLRVSVKRAQRAGRPVRMKARCEDDCDLVASGRVVARGGGARGSDKAGAAKKIRKKIYALKKRKASLGADQTKALKLKLRRRSAKRKLKRVVRRGGRATARIRLIAADVAGSENRAKRSVKLKKR